MKKCFLPFFALLYFVAIPVHAIETKISGFLSASVNMIDTDEAEYLGITDYPTFGTDSVIGLQFDTIINKELSVTVQLLAKNEEQGYSTDVSWGYLTYTPNHRNRFRVGRLATSDFYYSDFINVSYAYPWIRTPVEVYGNVPISSYDGVEWAHFANLGEWDFEFSARVGGFDENVELGGATTSIKSKTYWAVAAKLFYEDLSIRLSYAQPRIEMVHPGMEGFFSLIEDQVGGEDSVKKLRTDDTKIDFYNIAVHYDSMNWLLFAEGAITKRDSSPLPEQSSYYLGGGYRFNNWLPTLTYASRKEDARTDLIGTTENPVELAMVTGFVNSFPADQDSIILSLRWDFHKAAAIKFEFSISNRSLAPLAL